MCDNVLWLGSTIAGEYEKQLLSVYGKPFMIAQSNLEKALIKGLLFYNVKIEAWTTPTIPYHLMNKGIFEQKKKVEIENNFFSSTYPILKCSFLRYIYIFTYTFYIAYKFCARNKNGKIFIATNFLPVSIPTLIVGKIFRVKVTCMFCDLIDDLYENRMNKFRKYYMKLTKFVNKNFDSYVFITDEMNDKVNKKNRSYCVIEGIYNADLEYKNIKKKNIFIYSGSLIKKYGIDTAIRVFKKANLNDYELHIYGDGEYKEEMLKSIENEEKIKYKGLVSREMLFQKLMEAKFLLNLRDPRDEFTKYSFPSKIFEYLASGTCVISTKLEGIPEEYFDYMITCETGKDESLVETFKNVVNLNEDELKGLGLAGRKFVVDKKNSIKQAKLLYELLRKG